MIGDFNFGTAHELLDHHTFLTVFGIRVDGSREKAGSGSRSQVWGGLVYEYVKRASYRRVCFTDGNALLPKECSGDVIVGVLLDEDRQCF